MRRLAAKVATRPGSTDVVAASTVRSRHVGIGRQIIGGVEAGRRITALVLSTEQIQLPRRSGVAISQRPSSCNCPMGQ
jgi:hypothetical protein